MRVRVRMSGHKRGCLGICDEGGNLGLRLQRIGVGGLVEKECVRRVLFYVCCFLY